MTSDVPGIPLDGGTTIPQLGFGVFKVDPAEAVEAVATALRVGYRHIDTAAIYGNEAEVGAAIRESGLSRDEVFVTTKVWNDRQGYDTTLAACDESLSKLRLDHVDLYLIHWPAPALDRYVETWRALVDLQRDGRATSIGVSNFRIPDLERLLSESDVVPALNQIELHPTFAQPELREFHARHGIVTEAWAPLSRGAVLDHPIVTGLASRYGATPAQVVLRWHLQLGNVVIPKSVTPSRIAENFDVWGFTLDDEAMAAIDSLDTGVRTGGDPDQVN